jgi:hypothetical protein
MDTRRKTGLYCKTCGVDIRLNGDIGSNQSIVFNLENDINFCQDCKPRKESKYNQPYRRFWIKDSVQWSNLRRSK